MTNMAASMEPREKRRDFKTLAPPHLCSAKRFESSGIGDWGLGFRAQGSEFRVWGLGFVF